MPDWLPDDAWDDFVKYRKKKKTFTAKAAELAIAKLGELRGGGDDPREIINQSIMNGWTGLFPVRNKSPVLTKYPTSEERNRKAVEGFLSERTG